MKPRAGILGVDPELDGVPPHDRVVVAQRFALGDPEHLADEVEAGDLFRDRVFDLQPGVHLQERDGAVLAHQELAGAGTDVAGLAQNGLARLVQPGALVGGQERGRCLLEEFLVAPLQRAVAGRDHDDCAVGVGQALGFDVPGPVEVALDEALATAEGGDRLPGRGLEQLGYLGQRTGHLQATAPATESRLDRDRQPMGFGEGDHLGGTGHRIGGARNEGGAHSLGDVAGLDLVAQRLDRRRRRPDPGQPRVDHGPGEARVLGEEAVARMDRVGARAGRNVQDLGDVEVGVGGGQPIEGERLVRESHEQGIGIGVGVDGHAEDRGVRGRPDHPNGDLAAIGHQNLRDRHRCPSLVIRPQA